MYVKRMCSASEYILYVTSVWHMRNTCEALTGFATGLGCVDVKLLYLISYVCDFFLFFFSISPRKDKTLSVQIRPDMIPYVSLRIRYININIRKTTGSGSLWMCMEYSIRLVWLFEAVYDRLCMRMGGPFQDGLYCESLWNSANIYCTLLYHKSNWIHEFACFYSSFHFKNAFIWVLFMYFEPNDFQFLCL